jgi:acyl-coenzyme A thioesterase PaaI-like protein
MSASFPPDAHVLRDLDFEVEMLSPEHHRARLDLSVSNGVAATVEVGAVLTVTDLAAGSVCASRVAPDWMATSGLFVHLARPLQPGAMLIDARIVRAGRSTITVGVDLTSEASPGTSLGEGVVTFARIASQGMSLALSSDDAAVTRYSFPRVTEPGRPVEPTDPMGTGGSLEKAIGCSVLDGAAGVTETQLVSYVRNSFGAINGGVVATLIDVAARSAAGFGPVRSCTSDMSIHYLAQGRNGPIETRATVVRSDHRAATLRVDVFDRESQTPLDGPSGSVGPGDAGPTESPGRLMAVAHVGVIDVGSPAEI